MPTFKLKGAKAVEVKSGFEPYDGPEPSRNGMYRGVIKVAKHGLNSSKSEGFSLTLELEAAPGDPKGHAQFDGFPMFSRSIITDTADGSALKEGAQRNLSNFLAALGTKDEPDVVLDPNDDGDKVNVLKIGGKKVVGAVVNIDVQMKMFEGERRPEVGGIYPYKEIDAAPTGKGRPAALEPDEEEPEDDEADLMESDEAEGDDEFAAREEELNGLGIPALKKIAKELEIGISGTKAALVERILDAEFAEEDDSEADEDEPEDADEAEDEADEAEDDEAEEDDDEAEEEDEDDAEREARVAELADMNRAALKAVLKEIAPDFTVLKRHTDDDLREQIIGVEFAEDLPF